MPLSQRWTLTRYLIEERKRFPQASGELNALLLDVALACKALSRQVARGVLAQGPGPVGGAPSRPIEALADEVFVRATEWGGHLAGLSTSERDEPAQVPAAFARGKYLLTVAPLEGASQLDVGAPAGSLFSVLRAPRAAAEAGRDVEAGDFLQPGAAQVAAGYALHGPATQLVLSVGNGVAGFTLDPEIGEFKLTHPALHIPDETADVAVASDAFAGRCGEPPVRRYLDECAAGRDGARGKAFQVRGTGSLVAEAHRVLMRGGVVLMPRDPANPPGADRPRLLHEAAPVAFLMEQAGGRASTGRQPLLGVKPSELRQRIGLVFGARAEVERIERYHREPVADPALPLFAERGLFRG